MLNKSINFAPSAPDAAELLPVIEALAHKGDSD